MNPTQSAALVAVDKAQKSGQTGQVIRDTLAGLFGGLSTGLGNVSNQNANPPATQGQGQQQGQQQGQPAPDRTVLYVGGAIGVAALLAVFFRR